jgi:hypothetical protein
MLDAFSSIDPKAKVYLGCRSSSVIDVERSLGYRKGVSTSSDCGLACRVGLAACMADDDIIMTAADQVSLAVASHC